MKQYKYNRTKKIMRKATIALVVFSWFLCGFVNASSDFAPVGGNTTEVSADSGWGTTITRGVSGSGRYSGEIGQIRV